VGKDVFEDSKKRNNEGELMSGRVRMVKWTREIMKNHKPRTPKQIEKMKIRENKIIESLSNYFEDDSWLYKSSLDNKDV